MTIITLKIVKDDWDFDLFSTNLQSQIAFSMCRATVFSSHMTMVSNRYIFSLIWLVLPLTNPTFLGSLKIFFIFKGHYQSSFCPFTNYFLTIFDFFKQILDEFLNDIFTSINDCWFGIFLIIMANHFVTKSRGFMLLISLSIGLFFRRSTSINLFSDSFKISIKDKRYR